MAKDKKLDLSQGAGRLVHNPFAALAGRTDASKLAADAPSAGDGPAQPAGGKLVVRRERAGRGGKGVTIVEGQGLAGRDLAALAKDLAKALGAGARVEDGALVVQGEQSARVHDWLVARGLGPVVLGN